MYVDNCLIFSKNKESTDELINRLRENFTLTDEGDVNTYFGMQIELNEKNNTIELKQPFLTQRIIEALKCNKYMTGKENTALANNILHKDADGPDRKQS